MSMFMNALKNWGNLFKKLLICAIHLKTRRIDINPFQIDTNDFVKAKVYFLIETNKLLLNDRFELNRKVFLRKNQEKFEKKSNQSELYLFQLLCHSGT